MVARRRHSGLTLVSPATISGTGSTCLWGRRWPLPGRSGAGTAPLGSITLPRSPSRWRGCGQASTLEGLHLIRCHVSGWMQRGFRSPEADSRAELKQGGG